MNQAWLTVVVAVITSLTGMFSPVVPKMIERRHSDEAEKRRALEVLAPKLNDQAQELWNINRKLMRAYWDRHLLDVELENRSTPGEDEWFAIYSDRDSRIEGNIEEFKGKLGYCEKAVEKLLFSFSIKFPEAAGCARVLISSSNPLPEQDPFDQNVFRKSLESKFVGSDENAILSSVDDQTRLSAVKTFTEMISSELQKNK